MKSLFLRCAAGSCVGAVNGLFGGGGGMVAVPALKGMLGLNERASHATAILLILPISLISAIVYIVNGYFQAAVAVPAALGACIGGVIGAKLLHFLPTEIINYIFLALMFAAGVRMILP